MSPELQNRIARIAENRESGASEIVSEVISILSQALAGAANVAEVARAVCAAQPAMAPVWNAALAAVSARAQPDRLTHFAQRVTRAPAALARFAVTLFEPPGTPLRIATISYSGTVLHVLSVLASRGPLQVACAEGRPAMEGRRLAVRLHERGVPVAFFTDAAIAHALSDADAVLVGADAVGPEWFLNKSGTRMLASAASEYGTPLYVLASRDKFVVPEMALRLQPREGATSEVWGAPPAGVTVRNPYFEATPLHLVSTFITDFGLIGAGVVPEVCTSAAQEASPEALSILLS